MAKKPKKLDEISKKFGAEREKALNDALKLIEKDFGKGSIMRLGERAEQKVQVMSSGSLALDIALGSGGYPKGRIIEIYGPESSGKTTVALHAVAQAQKEGGIAAFIDAEHALDPAYAAALGVNIDELLLSQPDSGEQGLEIAGKLIDSGAVDLVVVDSVAALVPRAEIDGDIGDSHVGLQARMMSQAMRKLGASINKTKTIAIFINQLREKVGVMFGNPETTPGGRALKFYASVRLDVRGSTQIKGTGDQKDTNVGKETKIKVMKPQGTYLIWLDFSAYGLTDERLQELLRNEAKVILNRGLDFGEEGSLHARLNVAMPKSLLQEVCQRIVTTFAKL